jgi:O-acetyl-ADP-ribose deacetylase (regulator of RNase III)
MAVAAVRRVYGLCVRFNGTDAFVPEELKRLGPLPVGEAVATTGGELKAKFVIHAVGPRFQEQRLEEKLRETTLAALQRADEKGARSIAFPPMGTGFYGVPLDVSARVTLSAIQQYLSGKTRIGEIVLCVRDPRELKPFETALKALQPTARA